MPIPDFFVVGAQKSGTTSLQHYLVEHPEIYLPEQKETKFFVDDKQYSKGFSFYEKQYFSECSDEQIAGEVDPDYMYFSTGAERISSHIVNPKFIFIFRNPVDRAFSHYVMTYRRGLEHKSFEEAIRIEDERIACGYEEGLHYSYIHRGFYYDQVSRFLERWDRSQMHFMLSEDLITNPLETIQRCFEFLNVDSDFVPVQIGTKFHQATVPKNFALTVLFKNKDAYPVARRIARLFMPKLEWRNWLRSHLTEWNKKPSNLMLKDETRRQLIEVYRDENIKLSNLIGYDLSHWNQM